eukprot:1143772-Pelagomonas_calceolata.AAC.2
MISSIHSTSCSSASRSTRSFTSFTSLFEGSSDIASAGSMSCTRGEAGGRQAEDDSAAGSIGRQRCRQAAGRMAVWQAVEESSAAGSWENDSVTDSIGKQRDRAAGRWQ